MYLRIVGNITPNIIKEIASITDHARLSFRDIKYNKDEQVISLPIVRFGFEERKLLGLFKSYVRNKDIAISSLITIRNVDDFDMENNLGDSDVSEITIMFGLSIDDNEIYLSSVEEDKGITCFSCSMKVRTFDMEISDI